MNDALLIHVDTHAAAKALAWHRAQSPATHPCEACDGSGLIPLSFEGRDVGGVHPDEQTHRECEDCRGTGEVAS